MKDLLVQQTEDDIKYLQDAVEKRYDMKYDILLVMSFKRKYKDVTVAEILNQLRFLNS